MCVDLRACYSFYQLKNVCLSECVDDNIGNQYTLEQTQHIIFEKKQLVFFSYCSSTKLQQKKNTNVAIKKLCVLSFNINIVSYLHLSNIFYLVNFTEPIRRTTMTLQCSSDFCHFIAHKLTAH